LLVDHKYVVASPRPIGPLGGRPAIEYRISPRAFQ
jgi:hypothetical protein